MSFLDIFKGKQYKTKSESLHQEDILNRNEPDEELLETHEEQTKKPVDSLDITYTEFPKIKNNVQQQLHDEAKENIIIEIESNTDSEVLPIEERIRSLKPICNDLYPHEVLVLSYTKQFTTAHKNYCGFWSYQYGITDMPGLIQSLHDRGYITIGSLEDGMKKSNVKYLKSLLKEHNLKVSGRKADLINRLIENVPGAQLEKLFPERNYILTPKGTEALEKGAYIPYIHKHNIENLDIWNISELIHKAPDIYFKQAIWQYLEQHCKKYLKDKQYGLYRNCKFTMAELAMEEKLFDSALSFLFEVIYYDLSSLNNSFDGTQPSEYTPRLFPYECSFATIVKGILARLKHCKDELNISDCDLKEKMIVTISNIQLPFQIFTTEECADILLLELHEKKSEIQRIYKIAENRYKISHTEAYNAMMEKHAYMEQIRNDLKAEAAEENKIYDPEFEKEIEERLSKLDDLSRSEFYRVRSQRKDNDTSLSNKELDLLTLEAMERSYQYRK